LLLAAMVNGAFGQGPALQISIWIGSIGAYPSVNITKVKSPASGRRAPSRLCSAAEPRRDDRGDAAVGCSCQGVCNGVFRSGRARAAALKGARKRWSQWGGSQDCSPSEAGQVAVPKRRTLPYSKRPHCRPSDEYLLPYISPDLDQKQTRNVRSFSYVDPYAAGTASQSQQERWKE
jgi:hypothetical protein